jgi:hypothetical protein
MLRIIKKFAIVVALETPAVPVRARETVINLVAL